MERYIEKDGKRLRLGYTTGACAAAAAKGAAWMLLTGYKKDTIRLTTPKGLTWEVPLQAITRTEDSVSCAVEKDGGDDPDVTKGTLIFATVSRQAAGITIDGGEGVGRVTKRGLDQPVGAAAINSVPRRMIREGVEQVCRETDYHGGLSVIISVPQGEELAKRTFNPRLGIVGGISVLGTTGVVEPMSEQALRDTIRVELRQRRESGCDYVLLTPGNYGTEYIQSYIGLSPETAVQTSNFIGDTLDMCRELGFRGALLVGHIGKLVKIAGGMMNTHSRYGDCRMDIMAACAAAEGVSSQTAAALLECASCDEALRLLGEEQLQAATLRRLTARIGQMLRLRVQDELQVGAVLFSREYGFLSETENAATLLHHITEG